MASALLLGAGATPPGLHDEVDRYRRGAEPAVVRELAEFVAIPNVASDLPNIQRNADHLVAMLRARGAEARLLENLGEPPAVYGELRSPGAQRTIVFYAHYDGRRAGYLVSSDSCGHRQLGQSALRRPPGFYRQPGSGPPRT